jgi:hypothetical protein
VARADASGSAISWRAAGSGRDQLAAGGAQDRAQQAGRLAGEILVKAATNPSSSTWTTSIRVPAISPTSAARSSALAASGPVMSYAVFSCPGEARTAAAAAAQSSRETYAVRPSAALVTSWPVAIACAAEGVGVHRRHRPL